MALLKTCALAAALACLGTTVATAQDGPPSTPPLAPAITEIEVDWLEKKKRLRLKAQVVPRGAEVEKVAFRYRGKVFRARKGKRWMYARVVKPRRGDRRGKRTPVKVRACTATACSTRTERVKAR